MKGYKGMNSDMTCRGMQYEISKTYTVDGEIKVCRNGLHFCEHLNDVFRYYPNEDNNRYFEVYASGIISIEDNKCAASELTILRELSPSEVNRAINGNGYGYERGFGDGYGNGDGNADVLGLSRSTLRRTGYGDRIRDVDGCGRGKGYNSLFNVLIFQ